MRIIIAGCGRVGALLAGRLSLNDQVAVIDRDQRSLDRLGPAFAGSVHRGDAMGHDVLERAGIASADALVSVTSSDSINVAVCWAGREFYRVPRVISRVYDPRSAEIYRRLGLSAVSSTMWFANEIADLLLGAGGPTFGDGDVRIVSHEVPPRLGGRTVDSVERPGQIAVAAVVRSGAAFIPTALSELRVGDIVHLTVSSTAVRDAATTFTP